MEFVRFELAKKLKEKGYPQVKKNTLAMYDEDGEWYSLAATIDEEYCFEDFDKHDCVCPIISQVFKWLRKEKELYIEPCILADADTDADGYIIINEYTYWSFSVTNIETADMIYFEYEHIDDKRFDSYEQAALAGIEYVLDKLI